MIPVDAGVVDQYIHPAKSLVSLIKHGAHFVPVAHVRLEEPCLHGAVGPRKGVREYPRLFFFSAVIERQVVSGLCKSQGGRPADVA